MKCLEETAVALAKTQHFTNDIRSYPAIYPKVNQIIVVGI